MRDGRLLIVTGKGGTGRSAITAAIALSRQGTGRRVLAMALDDGRGLAAHLGLRSIGAAPVVGSGVHASRVIPSAALDEYVRSRIGRNPLRLAARVFRSVAEVVPGVRDVVLIGKVIAEAISGAWDVVVVDGPPAGQVSSLLRAPATIETLAPEGTVRAEAATLRSVLQDPVRTQIVVVATPDELAVAEAAAVLAGADQLGLTSSRRLVANRVLQDPGFTAPPGRDGAAGAAAVLHLGLRSEQQAILDRFRADTLLPLLFGTHRPEAVAAALAGSFGTL